MGPVTAPSSSDIDALLRHVIIEGEVARCAVAGVARLGEQGWVTLLGAAGTAQGEPTTIDTPFDLASVTKSVFAVTCARLVEAAVLRWSTPLAESLPELDGTPGGRATVADLLSHRAGLSAHVELFEPLRLGRPFDRARALLRAARALRPSRDPEALYSDLGYLLVGEALTRRIGRSLDEIVDETVCAPWNLALGSSRLWRQRDVNFSRRVAATEVVRWRGGELCGVVHDDNAWAFSGHGASGHAGLFGTARAVLGLGMALLDSLKGEGPLSAATARDLVRPRPGGSLRLGFDSKAAQVSMAGTVAGMNTFGHLGFTGTSFWCDPDADAVTVLLTNRVYPTQSNRRIRAARPAVHDALFQAARRLVPESALAALHDA